VISHIYIGITDFARAFAFYSPVMESLDQILRFSETTWAGWKSPTSSRPLFIIGQAYNGEVATPGNGQMVALLAKTREAVDMCYAAAIKAGGTCEGKPGLRPQYHPDFYGAYFRDPDGNKLAVCCHSPSSAI